MTDLLDDIKDYIVDYWGYYLMVFGAIIMICLTYSLGYRQAYQELQRPIIHVVDNEGGVMMGEITDKEIIDGKHTVTVGAYGKFLLTKEQYESISVGDEIPEYLKGRVYGR